MEPFTAKLVYLRGYWLGNFVIRAAHIKDHRRLKLRSAHKNRTDTALLLTVGIGGFLIPLLFVFTLLP
ncbi:MAG: hypothetical protein Q8M07_08890 [Prosthecobacter sp.]|nr:hypothetical protein [Prosthecobacter sp.]